ncbi:MAG: serine hydrolase [Planctomycetes bacterium]|nr:serine hydrolase [Planctomycetota bacterium]
MKLVQAIAALEAVNELAQSLGVFIDEHTPLSYAPLFPGERVETEDVGEGSVPPGQALTLERLITRALIASENEPANKLFEFVGWSGFRAWSQRHHLPHIRIEHRLSEFRPPREQRWTPRITLHAQEGTVAIPEQKPELEDFKESELRIGSAYRDSTGKLVHEGLDFSLKNRFDLVSAVEVLNRIGKREFRLTERQWNLIDRAMTTPPMECALPVYSSAEWMSERFKPMMRGLLAVRPAEEWTMGNKIGEAYGFSSDMATICHIPSGRVAHVAASIWCCASGILNTDEYEYESIGRPYLALVGKHTADMLTK